MLDPSDDIVIYCSNPSCPASIIRYQILERNGYKKIRRYAGGLQDWEEAGYPLEGSLVDLSKKCFRLYRWDIIRDCS